ncbi:MAG: glycoside hydrolase family 2 TIM barrel-domain containing protein [Prolixibacteraceae bacterium]
MTKPILFVALLFVICQTLAKEAQKSMAPETEISLNGNWSFKYVPASETGSDSLFYTKDFDASDWSDIRVPGHWELQGFAEPSYGGGLKEGTGLYRKMFVISPEFRNKQIFIQFEGVLYGYDVFINGRYAGNWSSAFNPARFNITDFVDFTGENLLAVKVSTRVKGYKFDLHDCWSLSGIYRPVSIQITPDFYIDDYTIETTINTTHSKAQVKVNYSLRPIEKERFKNVSIRGILHTPHNRSLKTVVPVRSPNGMLSFEIKDPVLWTAETPSLYQLELFLTDGKNVVQHKTQNVGIRQVSIEHSVLKLNDSPLKLRGVNHHDLVPETGRTLTREQILRDLKSMQRANINFIRTSHYPPDRRMLDLCDSLGIYVVCEVPFGGGDIHLTDTAYQDILLMRAKATLLRDKNHPCVIIWSVGNENPLTPITEVVGRYVQQTDSSRPICYPQMGSYFKAHYSGFPDFLDIYTPHYCGDEWIREFAKITTKPVLLTEYSHARGLAFGDLEANWKELFRNRQFAGGAVWHFHDQGILRTASHPVDRSQPTYCVWKDSVNYYDSNGGYGTDGIVYSDRTPQVDYWEVRKVYSPVQIIEDQVPVIPGKQALKFSVYNQFDFLNLNVLRGRWSLYKNREIVQTGNITVDCTPHDTVFCDVFINLPDHPESDIWYLRFDFRDKSKNPVYEHTVELKARNADMVNHEIPGKLKKSPLGVNVENEASKIELNGFCYEFSKRSLSLSLSVKNDGVGLITGGAYARVGRGTEINDLRAKTKSELSSWDPHLIAASKVENRIETNAGDIYKLSGDAAYLRGDDYPGERLDGNISYSLTNDGILSVSYTLKPQNVTGVIMEVGVSFILSEQATDFMWVGKGPYPAYPGKEMLSDFGIHFLKKQDLYFRGNRSNVSIAVLCDPKGNGIAVIGNHSNIAVEVENDQIIVSHIGFLTGKNTKVPAADVSEIKGEFKIIALRAGFWPERISELVGYPDPEKQPFNPFYHSYEQRQ